MTDLKARRRKQKVAKVEKVERRHGLENVELLHNHVPGDGATVEAVRHSSEVRCIRSKIRENVRQCWYAESTQKTARRTFGNVRRRKDGHHRVEFVQNLFEPQLVRLVNDDEQHLVVRRNTAELERLEILCR